MITRITKENRGEYVRLFAKATEALKNGQQSQYYQYRYIQDTEVNETNYEVGKFYIEVEDNGSKDYVLSNDPFDANEKYYVQEDFAITTLEEYFQCLQDLDEEDHRYVRLPLDEETFDIDLNTRQITIPAGFKKSGIAIQGDNLAEVVYFKVDRFFDMTDLSQTFIIIQWEAPNGKKMASPAYFPETDTEKDKLIFGWAITNSMTTMPGALKFSVAFVDGEIVNTDGNELDVKNLEYRLGTLIASVNINTGLNLASNGTIKFEDRLGELKNRIKNTPILGGIISGAADPAVILAYKNFDWNTQNGVQINNIFEDLIDDLSTGELETGLPLLAVSPNAGLIPSLYHL